MPEFESDISITLATCEKNVETQFTDDSNVECGEGINDRITSENVGRTTSEGECRTIA